MLDIFLSQNHPLSSFCLVIQGDDHSIWAYLQDQKSNQILLDGFLCSRGTILDSPSLVKAFIDSELAPPISKSFSNEFTMQVDVRINDFQIHWKEEYVEVMIKEILYLRMNWSLKKSYSRSVSKPGPYGYPLVE